MSSGHRHISGGFGLDSNQLNRLLKNEAVQEHLSRPFSINREYDLPYICGYSNDGLTVYMDRHLPELVKLQLDGKVYEFNPTPTLITHERTEKALIDALGYGYEQAHRVATAAERRLFVQLVGPGLWPSYQARMDQFAKADEHEKLKKLPKDLDMTPYEAKPVNKALLAHMEKLIGPSKMSKDAAEYDAQKGRPNHHCGPDEGWPQGYCEYYRKEHKCSKVVGWIATRGGCRLYEKADKA